MKPEKRSYTAERAIKMIKSWDEIYCLRVKLNFRIKYSQFLQFQREIYMVHLSAHQQRPSREVYNSLQCYLHIFVYEKNNLHRYSSGTNDNVIYIATDTGTFVAAACSYKYLGGATDNNSSVFVSTLCSFVAILPAYKSPSDPFPSGNLTCSNSTTERLPKPFTEYWQQNNIKQQQETIQYCFRKYRHNQCNSILAIMPSSALATTSRAVETNTIRILSCANKNYSRTYRISVQQQRCNMGDSKLWQYIPVFIRTTTLPSFHQNLKSKYFSLWQLLFLLITMTTFGSNSALLLLEPASSTFGAGEASKSSIMYNTTSVKQNSGMVTLAPLGNVAAAALSSTGNISNGGSSAGTGYLDTLDNIERSVAAVLIKVAHGTTSTTKRSIPENSYMPSLTTIATPLLTTLRYMDKSPHQQQFNQHHRNYELDLEKDHALPTSAPNADILKSNSNPTYPNPNRHHSHDRDRFRHFLNSTPLPSLPNLMKKNVEQTATAAMHPPVVAGDVTLYSPPARTFFTPPLPPEYQNPFHDKPILRGTNNEVIMTNTGTYINRRPIPPPSLMPGHERIPFRPPDIAASTGGTTSPHSLRVSNGDRAEAVGSSVASSNPFVFLGVGDITANSDVQRKKALNTPSRNGVTDSAPSSEHKPQSRQNEEQSVVTATDQRNAHNTRKEVLPSIRRILSGSNGNKGEIPQVLLKQVTTRPLVSYFKPPSSPVVLIDGSVSLREQTESSSGTGIDSGGNINKNKNNGVGGNSAVDWQLKATKMSTQGGDGSVGVDNVDGASGIISESPALVAMVETVVETSTSTSISNPMESVTFPNKNNYFIASSTSSSSSSSSASSSQAASAAAYTSWTIAWHIHVYLSVILFTVLAVYSLYKMVTYNKLTHLFSQSYFISIHLVLIFVCVARIFYLCYDAYNIHASLNFLISELLLNLPATFLTISFSVLILFLSRKALNHKNSRYSALIRPLTVVVGCSVHVVLCITLHYVESYTLQQQQQLYLQQQQLLLRKQQHVLQQQQSHSQMSASSRAFSASSSLSLMSLSPSSAPAPPRVLSLICQIIYIFICVSLGLIYLYIYRILKRILRSKSQNYIHGYQNLSYAIHITIATALLFLLLAVLQIFGAISLTTARPLVMKATIEIDWLQWGCQFSFRLIEIAIITLISWVAGLKTSTSDGNGGVGSAVTGRSSAGEHIGMGNGLAGGGGGDRTNFARTTVGVAGTTHEASHYQRHNRNHGNSNMAGFFLPCTYRTSQEQFDTDYPAVCQTNTNLHTYTMRTGKLIYDGSFALNSLSNAGGTGIRNAEYQQQPTYQQPYDTGSLASGATANHLMSANEYTVAHNSGDMGYNHSYADYLTDATTDHYENPNFDLRGSASTSRSGTGSGASGTDALAHTCGNTTMQKINKTSTTSTTASSSGGSLVGGPQQQKRLLLQSGSANSAVADSSPLEPFQSGPSTEEAAPALNYDFKNFERPKFVSGVREGTYQHNYQQPHTSSLESWSEVAAGQPLMPAVSSSTRVKKSHQTAVERSSERSAFERQSSNSCLSSNGSDGRYDNFNSFERRGGAPLGSVRKSGTFNSVIGVASVCGSGSGTDGKTKILTINERYHHHNHQEQSQQQQRCARSLQRGLPASSGGVAALTANSFGAFGRSSVERISSNRHYQVQQNQQNQTETGNCSSDDEDDDDDRSMLAAPLNQLQQYQQHPLEMIN